MDRETECWIAECNGGRYFKTCRGTASACWGALCGMQDDDPVQLIARGWKVIRFRMSPIESDLRYGRAPE